MTPSPHLNICHTLYQWLCHHTIITPTPSCPHLSQKVKPLGSEIHDKITLRVGFLVGCLTFQLHASLFQGRICLGNFTCCHTEREIADQTFCLTQSRILTPSHPVPALTLYHQVPGRGATWVPIFRSLVWHDPEKIPASRNRTPDLLLLRPEALNH